MATYERSIGISSNLHIYPVIAALENVKFSRGFAMCHMAYKER
jgi:hypothetical protein